MEIQTHATVFITATNKHKLCNIRRSKRDINRGLTRDPKMIQRYGHENISGKCNAKTTNSAVNELEKR